MIQGYRLAIAEDGGEETILYETPDRDENTKRFEKILGSKRQPTAIFSDGDHRILNYWGIIKKLGLSVPDDLALVGYYDTPHCLFHEIHLSSISIRLDDLAAQVVKRITAASSSRKRIIVKPELVIRESSGK